MIFVVTPGGELLTFHSAGYLTRSNGETTHSLYEKKDGTWVADVPASWLVTFERPSFSLANEPGAYADLKRALRNFDARTMSWKR